jgi:hypothetical protein
MHGKVDHKSTKKYILAINPFSFILNLGIIRELSNNNLLIPSN